MPLRLNGATSGYVQLAAPAVAGTTSLVLPTDSVQPGMVLVATSSFTTASTVSLDNCFTSTYDNYRVDYTITASSTSNAEMALRLRVAGVDSSASYLSGRLYQVTTTVAGSAFATNRFFTGYSPNSSGPPHFAVIDITRVAVAAQTSLVGRSTYSDGNVYNEILSGVHTASTAYDGFTIYPSAGTITGSLAVYGYRASITT